MKLLNRILAAIPIHPAVGGVMKNWRDPSSRVCAPADVSMNVADTFWSWLNRTPARGALFMRNRDGHHVGAIHRNP
jgi:hypothetical protein